MAQQGGKPKPSHARDIVGKGNNARTQSTSEINAKRSQTIDSVNQELHKTVVKNLQEISQQNAIDTFKNLGQDFSQAQMDNAQRLTDNFQNAMKAVEATTNPTTEQKNASFDALNQALSDPVIKTVMGQTQNAIKTYESKWLPVRLVDSLLGTNSGLRGLYNANIQMLETGNSTPEQQQQARENYVKAFETFINEYNGNISEAMNAVGQEIINHPDFSTVEKKIVKNGKKIKSQGIQLEETNNQNNKSNFNKWLTLALVLGSIAGVFMAAVFYANEKTGCWIWFSDNNSEKLQCEKINDKLISFSSDNNYYNVKDQKYLCGCGGSYAYKSKNGETEEAKTGEMKVSSIPSDPKCDTGDILRIQGAPYAIGSKITFSNFDLSCNKLSTNECGSCICTSNLYSNLPYCRGTGSSKGDFWYNWRQGSILDLPLDFLEWAGNFLSGGLNSLLKWVLIFMGVILGGAIIFAAVKKIIAYKPNNHNNENINIELSEKPAYPQYQSSYQQKSSF